MLPANSTTALSHPFETIDRSKTITLLIICLLLALIPWRSFAQDKEAPHPEEKTQVLDESAAELLLGHHRMALQWVSWDGSEFGDAWVTNRDGTYYVRGWQQKDGSFVDIDGRVLAVESKQFTFIGKVTVRYPSNDEDKPCTRDGMMTFRISGKRRYWRLKEMENPCYSEKTADYVDIFFLR